MQDKRNRSASLVASVSTTPPSACCHTLKGVSHHDPSVAAPLVFFFPSMVTWYLYPCQKLQTPTHSTVPV